MLTQFSIIFGLISVAFCSNLNEFEKQHMKDAHHIEVTDEVTFFKLHDLDKDGYWSEQELSAIYGIERDIDSNAQHIRSIIENVYETMDRNKDRFISLEEYIASTLPHLTKLDLEKERAYKEKVNQPVKQKAVKKVDKQKSGKQKANKTIKKQEKLLFQQQGANYIPNKFKA